MLLTELAGICLYQGILKDKAVEALVVLLRTIQSDKGSMESMVKAYCSVYAAVLEGKAPAFNRHVRDLVLQDENAFTLGCERRETDAGNLFARQAASDLAVVEKLASIRCEMLKQKMKEKVVENQDGCEFIDTLADWNPTIVENKELQWDIEIANKIHWHEKNGAGIFSQDAFFRWDGEKRKLLPVKNPDPITLNKLYLVESQKSMAVRNTEFFLAGASANNILFYGDRGTGKSSMVKALVNEFSSQGLKLVEIPKKHLDQIPVITSVLSNRGLKFVLFIDDLAFENNEEEYTALKGVLEGGIEHKPANILLYATSNRRHLVKESFSDRRGLISGNPDEEIRARDNIQEKLSLSDRFGITLVFSSPLQKEYLQIIHKMAEEEKLLIDPGLLEQKAVQWEMAYNGMSPRTARQFICWIKAELSGTGDV